MAELRCLLPTPAPNSRCCHPFPPQLSPAVMALTCALEPHGNGGEVNGVECFAADAGVPWAM